MAENFEQLACQCESKHYTIWVGEEVLHFQCATCRLILVVEISSCIYIPFKLVERHPRIRPLFKEEEST